ncbi:MAG: SprB repeat-containing protein, partial [Bacteroidota bacterium]
SGTGVFQTNAGAKTYAVTDSRGCTVDTSFVITQPVALTVSASAGTIACFGGSSNVTVTATGGTIPYTGTGTFSRSAGSYSFQVTDNNACSATSQQVVIQQPSQLSTSISNSGIQCFGSSTGTIDLTPGGGTTPYSYVWSNGSTSQDLSGLVAGSYSVTVHDANGCTGNNTATINQYPPITITGFTPIAANQGELFRITGSGLTGVVTVRFNTIPASSIMVLGDTAITTSVPTAAIDGPVTVVNQNGCSATSTQSFDYLDYYGNINLKVLIEGYNDNGFMVPALVNRGLSPNFFEVDTVRLLLADSANPSIIIDSAKAVLDVFGTAGFQFRGVHVGRSYYLIFRTMNTIETWSSEPILLNTQTTYDFTDGANKAYGDNQIEVEPGVWAIYSGELNADG